MTLGRLLMHVGWTLLCPGAGQGTAGKRRLAAAWAVAGLASAVAITWTFWAIPATLAVRLASAVDAAVRLRRVTDEDRNLPLYASLAAVLGFVFFQFTTERFAIPSDSMTPAIAVGDSVLVSTLSTPHRGDVIVFAHPCDGITHIKRAVALAGDTVEVRCGALYVNGVTHERATDSAKDFPRLDGVISGCAGRPLAGTVVHGAPTTDACALQAHFVVPADSVFVLGDNRAVSIDSRAWGVVPLANVKGRALGVVWPLAHASAL